MICACHGKSNPTLRYGVSTTLLKIASDPKHLGAEIGVVAILHTWGQNLLLHPTFTVSFLPAGSRWIIVDGSARAILSFYPSKS